MSIWQALDKKMQEAASLERKLIALGWTLLPAVGGSYRAQKRLKGGKNWKLVAGATPEQVLRGVDEEMSRLAPK